MCGDSITINHKESVFFIQIGLNLLKRESNFKPGDYISVLVTECTQERRKFFSVQ